ncbi:hypothetical protein NDR87_20285 [Nocardia sp. CDC159]|uniref:Secreted protein n=1 Tax=Nocardia pulmonis TaxID=2951408 RepID=A0A9X2E9V2_9NOCA|nr:MULTISPECIES: hypothetical protein [Nocardia]MCM6776285.1 hypothetical protein [Nocardia pulmonis]MCM6788709.1 hypothetical protein [Nocardia sp. CDC159]
MRARRVLAGLVSAVTAVLLSGMAATPAQADPLPQFTTIGTTLYTFGNANLCAGAIDLALEATPHLPGHVLAHVTPRGYLGGRCGNQVKLGWVGSAGLHTQDVYVEAGAAPGDTVTVDLWVGSGPGKVMAVSWPIRGTFAEWYLLVP